MDRLQLIEDQALKYLLSLPPHGTPGRPVLCFLHGLDEGPPTDIYSGLTRHGPLRPDSSPHATDDFIVVAPQLPEQGDRWHLYAEEVVEIVRQVQSRHGGEPQRTYLSGFSFGGNGVFDLAAMAPGMWTALWPVDPTRVPVKDPGLPVWLSSGQVSRFFREEFMDKLHLTPPGISGGGDRVYLDEGLDHVGTAASAYKDNKVYSWLLTKTA